ncbi:DUF4339 domain-containing protein [Neokomagataea thailandica]|uniref:DUF4339 domain-containing protein n=1 Tax=Neokomagataea TaxID=1223423 RepID=UPI0014724FDD|nr:MULTISPECIES: DUF4339 domain-containing protein [Neokomagataea]
MKWYYAFEGQQVGPITTEQLKYLAGSGTITPQTLVWRQGFGDQWRPAAQAGIIFMTSQAGSVERKPVQETWAWVFVLVPWLLNQCFLILSAWQHWTPVQEVKASLPLLIIVLGVSVSAFMADRAVLRDGGYRPPSGWWWLLPPGYCWARLRLVGRGKALFWVCILTFLISFGVGLNRAAHNPAYMNASHSAAVQHGADHGGTADDDEQENL